MVLTCMSGRQSGQVTLDESSGVKGVGWWGGGGEGLVGRWARNLQIINIRLCFSTFSVYPCLTLLAHAVIINLTWRREEGIGKEVLRGIRGRGIWERGFKGIILCLNLAKETFLYSGCFVDLSTPVTVMKIFTETEILWSFICMSRRICIGRIGGAQRSAPCIVLEPKKRERAARLKPTIVCNKAEGNEDVRKKEFRKIYFVQYCTLYIARIEARNYEVASFYFTI